MDPIVALESLIREEIGQQEQAHGSSSLRASYQQQPWKKLIVYRDGVLWEVVPVDNGQSFEFYELRLRRMGDPLVPQNAEQLASVEKEFSLEHGIDNVAHISILR